MADFLQLVSLLREQMNATLSRSDILRPLSWLLAILLSAELLSLYLKLPEWFSLLVAVLLVVGIALYFFVYGYSAFKQPDALRSERYSLHKLAIEHGIFGDSETGQIERRRDPEPKLVGSSTAESPKASEPR